MKLYNSIGPNPHVVRMFAAERDIELELIDVDLMAGENRQAPYLEKNPSGQLPCLELDDGFHLAEVTAICEYLDETAPGDSLIGADARQRAETRMWTRRVDLNICEPLAQGFRYSDGLALFKDRMITIPEAAEGLKRIAQDRLQWLDGQMRGKRFICGDRFSLADILLFCFLSFGRSIGQKPDPALEHIAAWLDRIGERPSAQA